MNAKVCIVCLKSMQILIDNWKCKKCDKKMKKKKTKLK